MSEAGRVLTMKLPRAGTVLDRCFRAWPRVADPAQRNVLAIIGPPGSGKTRMLMNKAIVAGFRQPPDRAGLRKWKLVVTHCTYRQLWRGPIETWLKIVPRTLGEWSGGNDQPAFHRFKMGLKDGTALDMTTQFLAYAGQTVEETMRGVEFSIGLLNEADEHPEDALFWMGQRAGRFPDRDEGGPWWYGLFLDANSPMESNWLADKMRREWREGREFFRQPPAIVPDGMGGWAVNPKAENLDNLPAGYYETQLATAPDWAIRRFLALEFGYDRSGLPVYRDDFIDQKHVAPSPIEPVETWPLHVGTDAGGSPAAAFLQIAPNGQVRVIAEVVAEPGTGPSRYAEMLKAALAAPPFLGRFAGREIAGWCDPAASLGGDRRTGEDVWMLDVSRESGIRFRIGGDIANRELPRLDSLRKVMRRDIDARTPGFLLSPACPTLREALNGKYRYRKKQIPGRDEYDASPEKNPWSHVVEALQYGVLGATGAARREDAAGGERRSWRALTEADPWDRDAAAVP